MWLITPIGFFSVVRKPSDAKMDTLTIRARVRSDLESLQQLLLPNLGEIREGVGTDYPCRATAPRADVAAAFAAMLGSLGYENFKDEVAKRQGKARAQQYHKVWDVLKSLEDMKSAVHYHPRPDDHGKPVHLTKPSQPTALATWADAKALARVVPDGPMPAEINGIAVNTWSEAPADDADWKALAAENTIDEPPFQAPPGYKKAAGVVLLEPDGRVWLVAPSNGYAGYQATFPKGGLESRPAQAAALVEAFEESGLKVRLLHHLIDVPRSESYTRYYLAERVGGNPADMGWESQAVMLAPLEMLPKLLNSKYDVPVIKAIKGLGDA